MPQEEYFGFNSIANLEGILTQHKPTRIFLVTGRASYEKCGAKPILDTLLQGYDVTHFYDFEVNPKLRDIKRGIKEFRDSGCDFVIAVGGGSVMDVAKAIRIFAANSENPEDYVKGNRKMENKGVPFAAIPTTSGSGSEATKFAVIYIDKTKYSLEHKFMLPDYAIVDPHFTMNLPRYVAACSGIDALAQAIESYWSINSTEESRNYAREAIKLVMKNLQNAVNNPNGEARESMAKAAHLAGKAINISKTTACHAISYPITSYFGVPHGHAVALTLGPMLEYNYEVTEEDTQEGIKVSDVKEKIEEIVALIGAESVQEASKKITTLMHDIGLKTRLRELGIKTDDNIELIIVNTNPERAGNNPRKLTEEALRADILGEIK